MPSWLIDVAFLEAAGIILVVTGCFVAGAISGFVEIADAEKANRRRTAEEWYGQMFTEAKMTVERCDQMLRCEQVLAKAESGSRSLSTHETDCAANNGRDLLRCCSDSVTEPTTFYADNVVYTIAPDADYRIRAYWDRTKMTENDVFVDLTARASKGERIGFACLSHSEAVMMLREYVVWLRYKFPTPNDQPSTWWSVFRSTCSVDFNSGGTVRFVSHPSQTDGIRCWR